MAAPDFRPNTEEAFNLGYAAGNIRLERKIFDELAKRGKTVAERAELVRGAVNGMLDAGRWTCVLEYFFPPKEGYGSRCESTVGPLFDSEDPTFVESLGRTANAQSNYNRALAGLLQYGKTDLLEAVFPKLAPSLCPEYLSAVTEALGTRADEAVVRSRWQELARNELIAPHDGSFDKAENYFEIANDADGMKLVYETLLEEPSRNFFRLRNFVERHEGVGSQEAVGVAAGNDILSGAKDDFGRSNNALAIYLFVEEKRIPFEKLDELRDAALQQASNFEMTRTKKKNHWDRDEVHVVPLELRVRWAELHTETNPAQAYLIFHAAMDNWRGYNGEYAGKALANALALNSVAREDLPRVVHHEHLLDAYGHGDLKVREAVLHRLVPHMGKFDETRPKIENWVRDTVRELRDADQVSRAYELWREFDLPEGAELDEMREAVISGGGRYRIDHDDERGQRMVVERALASNQIREAWEHAQYLADPDLHERVRATAIDLNPKNALILFGPEHGSAEPRDLVGFDRSLDALASRYNVPKSSLRSLVLGAEAE